MTGMRSDPLEELTREHLEVARPLLDRIDRIADQLEAGTRIPAGELAEGIELWDQYLHGVHLDRLEALQIEKSAKCGPGLAEVLEDHYRSRQRMGRLRELVADYEAGKAHARVALALSLRSDSYVDRVWLRFEEEHPFSCLARALSPVERAEAVRRFQEDGGAAEQIEDRIHQFLSRAIQTAPDTFEIRCNTSSCSSRAAVPYRGDGAGELRLGPVPEGWATGLKLRTAPSSNEPPRLAFFCPAHSKALA